MGAQFAFFRALVRVRFFDFLQQNYKLRVVRIEAVRKILRLFLTKQNISYSYFQKDKEWHYTVKGEISHCFLQPWLHFLWLSRQTTNVFQILVIWKTVKDDKIEAYSSHYGGKMFLKKNLSCFERSLNWSIQKVTWSLFLQLKQFSCRT